MHISDKTDKTNKTRFISHSDGCNIYAWKQVLAETGIQKTGWWLKEPKDQSEDWHEEIGMEAATGKMTKILYFLLFFYPLRVWLIFLHFLSLSFSEGWLLCTQHDPEVWSFFYPSKRKPSEGSSLTHFGLVVY